MIEIIIIVSFVVLFFYECTREGMVFSIVAKTLDKVPDYLKKPLFDCPICMIVWWGPSVIACGMLGGIWEVVNIWQLFIILAASAGLNTVLIYIIGQGKAISKALSNDYDCNCTKKESEKEKSNKRIDKINNWFSNH